MVKKKLGRGLSGLVEVKERELAGKTTSTGGDFREISIELVDPGSYQPRRVFDERGIAELASSIREAGVIQPVVVRAVGDRYELIAGERRLRAAKAAGLERLPAVVRSLDDESAAAWSIIENMQREDLNAMERADGLAALAEQFGLTHEQIAQRVGFDRTTVTNLIRMASIGGRARELLASGALSAGHGKALLVVDDAQGRDELARRAGAEGWSVRRLEREARALKRVGAGAGGEAGANASLRAESRSADLAALEQELGAFLGTKVAIRRGASGRGGMIEVRFFDLDHFDGLLQRIGFSQR